MAQCPQIDVNAVNCGNCRGNCPALNLKNMGGYGTLGAFPQGTSWNVWVDYCENLRRDECNQILNMHGQIRLYILTESIPYRRFIYDPQSNYAGGNVPPGLRTNLCRELLNVTCPNVNHCNQCQYFNQLLDHLRRKGLLIVDCALCPLHLMRRNFRNRKRAATICLNNNTIAYLNVTPNADNLNLESHYFSQPSLTQALEV